MAKNGAIIAVLLLSLLSPAAMGSAAVLTDPTGLYSTFIGDHWVYQAHHSSTDLMVFYGEADHELLYFQRLGPVAYSSARDFAQRSVELYGAPGGLEEFQLVGDFQAVEVAGEWGVSCSYSYQDGQGNTLWEYRIFLVLPGGEGFSIAFSDSKPEAADLPLLLEDILHHWRWLF